MFNIGRGLKALSVFIMILSIFDPWLKAYVNFQDYELKLVYFSYSNNFLLNLILISTFIGITLVILSEANKNSDYLLIALLIGIINFIIFSLSMFSILGEIKLEALKLALELGEIPEINIYFGESVILVLIYNITLAGALIVSLLE